MTTDALENSKARDQAARAAFAVAADRLARGRAMKASASAEALRQTEIDESWIERQQRRNEAHLASGASGPPPALVADVKAQLAKASADANLRAWTATVESLERVHAERAAEAAAAERELRAAADGVLTERGDAFATELTQLRERSYAVEAQLRGLLEAGVQLSAEARVALALHCGNWIDVPVGLHRTLEESVPSSAVKVTRAEQAAAHWRAERAALMQGDPAATTVPNAECAV